MQGQVSELEALGLRPINEPGAVDWWPLGPGWWVLATVLIIALATLIVLMYRRGALRRRAMPPLRDAVAQWHEAHDDRQLLETLNAWLRRVAMLLEGRTNVAALVGSDWQRYLDRCMDEAPFTTLPGQLLIDHHYRPDVPELSAQSVTQLEALCSAWLVRAERQARGRHGR